MNGYVTNPNNWKVSYVIEYIDDKRVWDNLEKYTNPWEHYKKKEFSNLSEAITLYSLWHFQDNIYDCKLFAHWETESGDWYEEYIAFESTYRWGLGQRLNRDMNKVISELHQENDELTRENTTLIKWLKDRHVDVYAILNEEVA